MAAYISRHPAEQVYIFRGTLSSSVGGAFPENFNAVQRRTATRQGAGSTYSANVEEWVGPDGRIITAGAAYVRTAKEASPGVVEPAGFGSWVYWCQSDSEEFKKANPVQLNRQAPSVAGQPMRTRYGTPVVLPDGTTPLQPASGQPSRDEWSGELDGGTQA